MSPLLLTFISLKDGTFAPVMSCFAQTVEELLGIEVGWDHAQTDPDVVGAHVRRLARLIDALEEDDRLHFFQTYCSKITDTEPSLLEHGFDLQRLANDFFSLIEQGVAGPTLSNAAEAMSEDDTTVLAAHILGTLRQDRLVLLPAAYVWGLPFVPTEATASCLPSVISSVPKSGHLSLGRLRERAQEKGIYCSLAFLATVARSDHRLLTVAQNDGISVVRRADLLPALDSMAHNVKRSDLVSGGKRITVPDEEGFRTCTFEPPKVNGAYVGALVVRKHGSERTAGINWNEVGVKMLSIAVNGETTIQGMSASLHQEIVRTLRERGEAMTLDQLERALSLPLRLSPEELPPGQIMAYAPHPRFLRPENAVYVLKDWVETDTQKRARILRIRVVTPFREKSWEFESELLAEVIRNDELYKFCGLITIDSIVNAIATRLEDKPFELYYRRLIKVRIQKLLDSRFIDLGRGVFTNAANNVEKKPNESNDSWRAAVLHNALGRPRNLLNTIASIENAAIRTQLGHVARGMPSDGYLHL